MATTPPKQIRTPDGDYFARSFSLADEPRLHIREYTDNLVAWIRETGGSYLYLDHWDDPIHGIEFLAECADQIRVLWIGHTRVKPDLSPISALANLEELYVGEVGTAIERIDFARLRRLRRASFHQLTSFGNLAACAGLEELKLLDTRLKDLSPLAGMAGLKRLQLGGIRLGSLDGVSDLAALRVLELCEVGLKTLDGVEALAQRFPNVRPATLQKQARGVVTFDVDDREEADRRRDLLAAQDRGLYRSAISPESPACLVLLIDQSGSMQGNPGAALSYADGVAEALNRFTHGLVLRCTDAGVVRPLWHVGAIAYGGDVRSALPGALAQRGIVPISELAAEPTRLAERHFVQEAPTPSAPADSRYPVRFESRPAGGAPFRAAILLARDWLDEWTRAHPRSFPPLVINLSDGAPRDGHASWDAAALKALGTDDGHLLFFSIIPPVANCRTFWFPERAEGYWSELFGLCTPMPPSIRAAADAAGYGVASDRPGLVGFAGVEEMIEALVLFTAVPGMAEARQRVPLIARAPRTATSDHGTSASTSGTRAPTSEPDRLESLTGEQFWRLIAQSRRGAANPEDQVARLQRLLERLDAQQIIDFDRCFNERIAAAFLWDLWGVAYLIHDGCSDDGFDYFLGWLILQGRTYYETSLTDPEAAAKRVKPGAAAQCEAVWYAAARAFEATTGESDFDARRWRVDRTAEPAGEAWSDDEELTELYPNVARRFRRHLASAT